MPNTPRDLFLELASFSGSALKRMDANLGIHGISFSEYRVLDLLSSAPGYTLPRVELARGIGLTPSGVTRMLAPMEKIGLVAKESHPRDARMSLVKLSDAGQETYTNATITASHVASDFLESVTKTQREALSRLFSGLE